MMMVCSSGGLEFIILEVPLSLLVQPLPCGQLRHREVRYRGPFAEAQAGVEQRSNILGPHFSNSSSLIIGVGQGAKKEGAG